MGYEHTLTLTLEERELVVGSSHHASVDVAIYTSQWLEFGYLISQLYRAKVSCVPDFIDIAKKVAQSLVECAVCVGYYTYAFHLVLFAVISLNVVHNLEVGLTFRQIAITLIGLNGERTASQCEISEECKNLVVIVEHRRASNVV